MELLLLNYLIAGIAVASALRFGGQPERLGAFALLTIIAISIVGSAMFERTFETLDYVSLLQDFFGFCSFFCIALLYKRIWPLWASALQLLSVGTHFIVILKIPIEPLVYAWMKSGPTWGVLILLIIGTLGFQRSRNTRDKAHSSPD